MRPGARRPRRSTWLTASRLIRIGWASRTSRSRSDTLVPVWLISSGSQPFARAWVTSPGEQASMPTLSGVPGAPRARRTARIRWSGQALRANRVTEGRPVRARAAWRVRTFSRGRARSWTKSGVPCSRTSASRSEPLSVRRPSARSRPGRRHQVGAAALGAATGTGAAALREAGAGTVTPTHLRGEPPRGGECASRAAWRRSARAGSPGRQRDRGPPRRASRPRAGGAPSLR